MTRADAARLVCPAQAGALLRVHVQPGARREGVGSAYGGSLKVSVRARAEDGRANQALLQLLARLFAVAPTSLSVASGLAARDKRVRFSGLSADELVERLMLLSAPAP